jgi:hypothetical protein
MPSAHCLRRQIVASFPNHAYQNPISIDCKEPSSMNFGNDCIAAPSTALPWFDSYHGVTLIL